MLKKIFFWLAVFAAALMFVFLGWAFSQHGTIGLVMVNGTFQKLFIILGVLGLVLLGLAVLEWRLQARKQKSTTNMLSTAVRILTVLCIVIFVFGFFYVGIIPGPLEAGQTPQLLIESGSGTNGVPNMAVTYRTPTPSSDTLIWGSDASAATLKETTPTREHIYSLTNLQPDIRYWYQIDLGQKQYFNSLPAAGEPLHFAITSDAHFGAADSQNNLTAEMLQQIANPANKYNLLFSMGDLVEHGFTDSQWQTALQAMSAATETIPTKYAVGNHDTLLGGLSRWETYCDPAGMPLQNGTQLYQRFDVGNVHFLVIDLEWSAEDFNSAQSAWLEQQLVSIPKDDWKIVIGHGFYYASGSIVDGWKWYDNPATIDKLTPIFEKYGVDMVFSGHDHQMELLQKSGVSYVIAGTFGGALDPQRTYTSPESVWYSSTNFGFADVTITGNTADLIFRAPDGKAINSFTIPKN
jgi:UDP-2,3-diacylglucosamine pyrophosphatase LpxH